MQLPREIERRTGFSPVSFSHCNTPALAKAEPWPFPWAHSIKRDPKSQAAHSGFSSMLDFTAVLVCEFGGRAPTQSCCEKLIHGCRHSGCRPTHIISDTTLDNRFRDSLWDSKFIKRSMCCSSQLMSKLQHGSKPYFSPTWADDSPLSKNTDLL